MFNDYIVYIINTNCTTIIKNEYFKITIVHIVKFTVINKTIKCTIEHYH